MQPNQSSPRSIHRLLACLAISVCIATGAQAAEQTVRVATQFGLAYLPLVMMEHDHLWEKQAKTLGVDIKVDYLRLGGGGALNDALISDSADVVAGGLAPMLVVWDKTTSSLKVKGLSAINASPMDILTNKPGVHSLKDLAPEDKIAVPSIRVSIQAIGLMAAAEKTFGPGRMDSMDSMTVAMQHPDALSALMASNSPIAAYVSSSPFQDIALRSPKITKLMDSFEAFGGPGTFAVAYTKEAFVKKNPKIAAAYFAAIEEANALIASDKKAAVEKYIETTKDGTDPKTLTDILDRPDFTFSDVPVGTLKIAQLMKRAGLMRNSPDSWKAYFVEPLLGKQGS